MKVVFNKIYFIAKVLAVCLVLIAALGMIYNEFIENDNFYTSSVSKNINSLIETDNASSYDSFESSNLINEVVAEELEDNKVSYNSRLSLSSYHFDDSLKGINETIKEYDITVLNNDYRIYNTERSNYFYLRVKSSQLDEVIDKLKTYGNVTLFNKDAVNITDQYYDAETRIESLESQLQRFYSLLNESNSVSELSNIYSEIDYLETQLEYAKRSLNGLDEDIDYSTITLNIVDVHKYNDDGALINSESFIDDFVYSLGDSWVVFINFVLGAIITLVYMFPFILFITAVIAIVIVIRKKIKPKSIEQIEQKDKIPPQN